MNGKHTATLALGALVGAMIWKGREVRSRLTMSGAGWANLHPDVKRRASAVLKKANKQFKPLGLSVGIFEGWRTEQRQREVMGTGNSFVNDWKNSYHPWGLAVDFVFIDRFGGWTWEPVKGDDKDTPWYEYLLSEAAELVGLRDDPNRALWNQLGEIIEGEGFQWGGRWRSFDGPHAQLPLSTTASLTENYYTPAAYIEANT